MKHALLAAAAVGCLAFAGQAQASPFPAVGLDASPYQLITLNADGTATLSNDATQSPTYDGSDDTYVGVINNSGHTVSSLTLSASDDIFGFDGDGLTAYGIAGNSMDPSGYGGPDAYFTSISADAQSGMVNFIGGLSSGSTAFFALEEAVDSASFSQVTVTSGAPEPSLWVLMISGVGMLGSVLRRRRTLTLA